MFYTNPIQSLALSTGDVSAIGGEDTQYELTAPAPLPLPATYHIFASPYAADIQQAVQITSRQKILSINQNTIYISDFTVENPRQKVPAILQTAQKQVDIINEIFAAVSETPSIYLIIQELSLLRLPKTPPADFGLYYELGCLTEPSDVNTDSQVLRATFYLLAVLFGTHFYSKIELPYLYFEQENTEVDYRARYYTLKKWFQHYLYNYCAAQPDLTQRVLSFIALGKYTEAAAILSEKRQNRLALIVCAGRVSNWKYIFSELNETQIINAELVLRALAGDLTAYNGYLCSWIELFAAALQKCETVENACIEYAKVAGALDDGHFLMEIIRLYADKRKRRTIDAALQYVEAISLHRKIPPLCGLLAGKFLVDQLRGSSVFATPISYEQSYSALRRIMDKLAFRAGLDLFAYQRDEEALRLLELFKSFTDYKCVWCYAKICAAFLDSVDQARAVRYMGQAEWQRIVQGTEESVAVEEDVIDIMDYL